MGQRVINYYQTLYSLASNNIFCNLHVILLTPAALERTFLGYLRTSLALSMIGVVVAQLFRLQHSPTPNSIFGFYVLGKPLACICQGAAIYSLLLGAYRVWRIQNAMVRGKTIAGGFEVFLLGVGVMLVCPFRASNFLNTDLTELTDMYIILCSADCRRHQ
jgi:uncharacterized membrane protein YidH (DUF202 family)